MLDLLVYVPTGPITIKFLNCPELLVFKRPHGQTPLQFKQILSDTIAKIFLRPHVETQGSIVFNHAPRTKFKRPLRLSLPISDAICSKKQTAFYVLMTEEPDEYPLLMKPILKKLLFEDRANCAQQYPVTFIGCTKNSNMQWARDLVLQSKSTQTQLHIVLKEQLEVERETHDRVLSGDGEPGSAEPLSYGDWIIGCLTAALSKPAAKKQSAALFSTTSEASNNPPSPSRDVNRQLI